MDFAGGHSDYEEVDHKDDQQFRDYMPLVNELVDSSEFEMFEPVMFTQQVVAGMIY